MCGGGGNARGQVPEWAPKEFHKLYYAFMDDAQRSKQRELRSQDGRARGAGARVDRDVNQPWHLLSEDILANADHRNVAVRTEVGELCM